MNWSTKVIPFHVCILIVFVSQPRNIRMSLFGFPKKISSMFHISDFIRRMFTLKSRYWLEIDFFFEKQLKKTEKLNKGLLRTVFLFSVWPLRLTTPTLSRPEIFTKKYILWNTTANARNSVFWFVCHLSWGFWYDHCKQKFICCWWKLIIFQQWTSPPLVSDSVHIEHYFFSTEWLKYVRYCTL